MAAKSAKSKIEIVEMADKFKSTSSVGERLRELRKQRNLTLEALAARSGISVSSLSRIENTRLSLNVEKIQTLATALDVPPETFLGAAAPVTSERQPPRLGIDRSRNRQLLREGEIAQHYMFRDVADGKLDCIYFEVEPAPIWSSEFVSHPGEKVLYVLAGELLVYVQGRSPTLLETGDSLYMDGNVWHSTVAANGQPARVLTVYCSGNAGGSPGNFDSRYFSAEEWAELNL